jgi:hypothetical protein
MAKNEFSLPDPVGALEKRIQRANRSGLVNLAIEEKLGKPPTEAEMNTLGFSESTRQLLRQLQGSAEDPVDQSLRASETEDGETGHPPASDA